ncbi:hypothetical protein [Lacticaseibacillus hulanensis]|uniref:hypothetical protein n=1 Tax=Lacticaseibacillus hulanensis TaxID=2493111 RepID=UPI0013E29616|nr:hypothetical protein [Lacticaseibacillus hulanensis]
MMHKWWVRGLLVAGAIVLGGALVWLLRQEVPNVFAVGIIGALLGCMLALILTSFFQK